ncbi:substrate-binding domain-containing protein [Methylocaldum szegediense]|uniref:Molybdate transport system substrate-binding protein n=1 Tax=Methylocaldum szegediense TaxID=73780 RepID=A0ABN8X072_9GAMM|nr:substrate-binding domain-containing protein [Methylocaldum szegediense]CAI8733457.1 molybdate transport system substrate-binding protein [Methylocaldum szegediense]
MCKHFWPAVTIVFFAASSTSAENSAPTPSSVFPPWRGETPPAADTGVPFTVPEVNNMPDFHGNPTTAEFVVFAGGNYFFVLKELVEAFQRQKPELRGRIFFETIPPGIIERQLENRNTITVGNLTLSIQPDVVQAGEQRIAALIEKGVLQGPPLRFVKNSLAIMVKKGNPKNIRSLEDLARPGVRLANPNPETEGITRQIRAALEQAGGQELVREVYETKVKTGEAFLTEIHHRQTPLWIMQGKVDAGLTWISEPRYQMMIGHPIDFVPIAPEDEHEDIQAAAIATNARNPGAARDWLAFLRSDEAKSALEKFGMTRLH